jgi:UDP-2,3-diacylglucosamine pyrophosphatase LpxH
MGWLQSQLAMNASSRNTFVFSHVSPLDGEFDPKLKKDFTDMLQQYDVRLSIHGHQHSYSITQLDGQSVKYLVVATIQKRSYALITVSGQTYTIEQKSF